MVKLILEIKEEQNKKFKEIVACEVDVHITEIIENGTKSEIKSSNFLKDKLGIEQKIQIIDECRKEENKEIVEILKSFLR